MAINMSSLVTPTALMHFDADKDDVEEWLFTFETVATGAKWAKDQRVAFLPLFLGTTAKQWWTQYKILQDNAGNSVDWDTLSKAFTDTFTRSEKDKKKAGKALRERKQKEDESIDDYVYSC